MARITYFPLRDAAGINAAEPTFEGLSGALLDVSGRVTKALETEGGFIGNLRDNVLEYDAVADPASFAEAVLPQQAFVVYSFKLDIRPVRAPWPSQAALLTVGDVSPGNVFGGVRLYLDAAGRIVAEIARDGLSHSIQSQTSIAVPGMLHICLAVDLSGGSAAVTLRIHRPGFNSPIEVAQANFVKLTEIDFAANALVRRLSIGASFLSDGSYANHAGPNVRISDLSIFKYNGSSPPDTGAFAANNSASDMRLDDIVLGNYPEHFRLRLGAPIEGESTVGQRLRVITFNDPTVTPVTASLSPGNVPSGLETTTVQAIPDFIVDEMPARGIWGVTIEFTGLRPFSSYSYSVQQAGDGKITGSFHTIPARGDHSKEFEIIFVTCDGQYKRNPSNLYSTIKSRVAENSPPVLCMMLIDDIDYVDGSTIDDPITGFVQPVRPQDQESGFATPEVYSKVWARSFGLYQSVPKWRETDRQWVYRHLPACYSGGDHAIEGNHCRGGIGNTDYKGCDRGPGSLEEAAKISFDLFYNVMNPPPLRAGKWHWGIEIGSARFALWDTSLYCQPYVTAGAGGPSDLPRYSAEQIADVMGYLSTPAVPFKLSMHESGIDVGQPWGRWCPTEYAAWKAQHDADNNLNGVDGSHIFLYGDNHSAHVFKYDTFWSWCPGTVGDSKAVVPNDGPYESNGELVFAESSLNETADRFIAFMASLRIVADISITVELVKPAASGSGVTAYAKTLLRNAADNQMT